MSQNEKDEVAIAIHTDAIARLIDIEDTKGNDLVAMCPLCKDGKISIGKRAVGDNSYWNWACVSRCHKNCSTKQIKDFLVLPEVKINKNRQIEKADDAPTMDDGADRREGTSPENGKKGGRPPINIIDIAIHYWGLKQEADGTGVKYYRGSWYVYTGGVWKELPEDDFIADLTKFIQDRYLNEINRISRAVINDVILNLQSLNMCFLPTLKQEPFYISGVQEETSLFNMRNGLIDRATLELKPHTSDLFSTTQLPYDFIPDAKCPRWLQYLAEVQPDVPDNIQILQLMFGLALIPETRFNVAFYLYGEGGTGKSVCLHILTKLVGEHNICVIPLHRLAEKFSLYPLTTKLLNIVGEMPMQNGYGELVNAESRLKEITDGAIIDVERKMENPYQARVTARCVFATNNLPLFSDRSNGLWDRLRIISFKNRIRGTVTENNNLRFELEQELPGIFLWALEGLKKLQSMPRFPDTAEGREIREEHRNICDHERVFLSENYKFAVGCQCETKTVYEHYRSWCCQNGYKSYGEARFGQAVKRIYPKVVKSRISQTYYWQSLGKN